MKKLWTLISQLKVKKALKNTLFLGILILLSAAAGAVIWLLAGRFLLPGIAWLLCFIGYPAVLAGFFGGILYLDNHDFGKAPV